MIAYVFWILLVCVGYAYGGYPLLLSVMNLLWRKPINRRKITPTVSLILAVYNEERVVEQTLRSILSLDYPKRKREIIVVSDCSTDRTSKIVQRFRKPGVQLIIQPSRQGKTAAQNAGFKRAQNEILVFLDAGTRYDSQALRQLVLPFADESVGAVSGVEWSESSQFHESKSVYLDYEHKIRQKESNIGSLIGVGGCLYALRKSLYPPLPNHVMSDFLIASQIVRQGYRVVQTPLAIAFEQANKSIRDEFRMRVRIAVRTFVGLRYIFSFLNPLKWGFYSVALFSHKLLRYVAPLMLIAVLISNTWLLLQHSIYIVLWFGQLMFYTSAILGGVLVQRRGSAGILNIPFYILLGNVAILTGMVKYIFGEQTTVWQPRRQ